MASVLVNLAWGSPKVDEEIYKLIHHLIEYDIRCFGYLVKTSIFMISKLKIGNNEGVSEENWSYYISRWQNHKFSTISESL